MQFIFIILLGSPIATNHHVDIITQCLGIRSKHDMAYVHIACAIDFMKIAGFR
jgi:hypothetical protein